MVIFYLLYESGRFLQQRMTERKQHENDSVRHEGKHTHLTKAHNEIQRRGEGTGSRSKQSRVYGKAKAD